MHTPELSPTPPINADQQQLLDLALQHNILQFGDFTLKSGRKSPYFFNVGQLANAQGLRLIGRQFAASITQHSVPRAEVVFGPAYKGIPLAVATALCWNDYTDRSVEFAYCRKEAKNHGEGGTLVGASLTGKNVAIVDDVLTAGTAARQALNYVREAGGKPVGLWVVLDREEPGLRLPLAHAEIQAEYGIPVYALLAARVILSLASGSV